MSTGSLKTKLELNYKKNKKNTWCTIQISYSIENSIFLLEKYRSKTIPGHMSSLSCYIFLVQIVPHQVILEAFRPFVFITCISHIWLHETYFWKKKRLEKLNQLFLFFIQLNLNRFDYINITIKNPIKSAKFCKVDV